MSRPALIAQTLARRRLAAIVRPTAAKVRQVWKEARADAEALEVVLRA